MALNQDEIEGMEIQMEVEEEATNSEVQVDVGSEEESDKALSNSNLATPKRGRGRPPKNGSVSKSDKSLSNGNPSIPKRGRGRPPKNGSVSKSDNALSNCNPSTPKRGRPKGPISKLGVTGLAPKRGRPKGSVFMKTKMLKVISLAAACLPRKPVDPSPKKRGRPSKVESIRKILTPKEEDRKKLESQLRRPRIYPRKDSPVTEPRGRGRPRKTEDATKPLIYDGPPRKRGRPPGAANKVKREAEQDKANSEPPVKRSFHSKEKSKEAGFPPVEESDQEDEMGRVDQESEKWKVEYREDPKKPVTPSDPTSFLWASHITPKRGRPKGSVSKLGASPITPNRGRPKGSVSKLLGSPITPNRGRPKVSVFTQPKMLKVIRKPLRGRPRKVVAPSPNKHGRPSKVESIRKILTPKGEEYRKQESQPRRPPGRPRIYTRDDPPVTEPRGRGRPRKMEDGTKPLIYDGSPRKRGRPPGAANKVKREAEQDKANSEPPVKCYFHSKEKSEEAGFPPVEESDEENETGRVDEENETGRVDEENETGRVDEENETGKNIEKSPRSQLPPVTVIALSVP